MAAELSFPEGVFTPEELSVIIARRTLDILNTDPECPLSPEELEAQLRTTLEFRDKVRSVLVNAGHEEAVVAIEAVIAEFHRNYTEQQSARVLLKDFPSYIDAEERAELEMLVASELMMPEYEPIAAALPPPYMGIAASFAGLESIVRINGFREQFKSHTNNIHT